MKKILLGLASTFLMLQAQIPNTKQLIVVTTQDWSVPNGTLQRYEKTDKWQKVVVRGQVMLMLL